MRHCVARSAPVLLAATALSACATLAPHQAPAPPPQPLAHLDVATPAAGHDVMAQLLTAQFAVNHDDVDTAARAYAKAAAVSSDPQIAARAVKLALAAHDDAGARHAIRRWAALGASDTQLASARAQLALDSGDTAGARAELEKLVTSGDKDAWRVFGRLLMGARDTAQAGQLLEAIATPQRLPPDAAAWLAMSELGDRLGRHAYAGKLAKAAVARFHCADCYAWAAQLQFQTGHHTAARRLYAKAIEKAPDSVRLRLGYASLLGQTGDNAAAAHMLAKGPQDAGTFKARAAYAARANDKHELGRIYRDLQRAPGTVRAQSYYLLGSLAASLDKPGPALDWFAQVPQGSAHRFDAHLRSALLWQRQGQSDKALAAARRMVTEYVGQTDRLRQAIALEANLYMGTKEYAKAIASFSRALELDANDANLLYGRGVAYAEAGNVSAAITDLRRVLKLKPHDIDAVNALGFTLADADRDLKEATSLITRAHKARPHDPAITDSWGWLQYRLGHLAAAEKALQQAWKAGKDPQVGGHLAEVLWKRGDHAEARRVLAAARKLAPHDAGLRALAKKISL